MVTKMLFCIIDILAQQVKDLTENIEQLRTKSQSVSQNTLNFQELSEEETSFT